jgi:lysyl-tRNA synthetase class 2
MHRWRPGADIAVLRARGELLASIRGFFADRGILEVETPLLCSHGVSDPSIASLRVPDENTGTGDQGRYLQSSPEYAMKRLLAAGSGPIYQLTRAFRGGEAGMRHNPEFSLLEWYRPGFEHHQLMEEVADLVMHCIGQRPWRKCTYRTLFMDLLGLDPFTASLEQVEAFARARVDVGDMTGNLDLWLDLVMSHLIEPQLIGAEMVFVYDYPVSQAALARTGTSGAHRVAHRFELYVDGLELANGYFELADPEEQRRRFSDDNQLRAQTGLPAVTADERLLAALASGLPDCSGVALGVDRLLMLAVGARDIRSVVTFDWSRS